MKALIVLGSRNPGGQTARAADAIAAGVAHAGGTVTREFLPTCAIERCRQCDDRGWGICRTEGRCVIRDDLPQIADAIRDSDAVVFATPVYFSDVSESLRAFLDRLRRTCMHESGKSGIAGTPAIGVCVAGGGGGGAPACTVSLGKILATCGLNVVDMVPVRRQNLDLKCQILKATGEWLAGQCGS